MAISNEGLVVILLVGLIAGWLAAQFVQGTGFGIIGDIIIGIIGAFIGAWLLPQLGIRVGGGIGNAIASATRRSLVTRREVAAGTRGVRVELAIRSQVSTSAWPRWCLAIREGEDT